MEEKEILYTYTLASTLYFASVFGTRKTIKYNHLMYARRI